MLCGPQIGLRQSQDIDELESYITDVHGVSYGSLRVNMSYVRKNLLRRGARALGDTIGGETHMGKDTNVKNCH